MDLISQAISARKFVKGCVAANGTIASGEGFTVNKTGTGVYVVTLNSPFVSLLPVATLGQTLTPVAEIRVLDNVSVSSFTVETYNNAGAAADSVFFFHAFGRD